MRLTSKKVERATERGRYGDGYGLYLEVRSPRNRQWILRWERVVRDETGAIVRRPDGRAVSKEYWVCLGPAHTLDLEEARDKARDARRMLARGEDPREVWGAERKGRATQRAERAFSAARLTFKQAAAQFFESRSVQWTNRKHSRQFTATMERYVYPLIGAVPVEAVDTPLVMEVLNQKLKGSGERFWLARPETASRVRRRIEWVLSWATVSGHRSGSNPAIWRGHLDQVLPSRNAVTTTKHHSAMAFVDVPGLLAALKLRDAVAAKALQFLILTAARTGEITGARWSEIDLKANLWVIPAERMKAKKAHRVPLCDTAIGLLDGLPREGDYVFPGGRLFAPMSNMAMTALMRRMGLGHFTVHGFRSAFRDWAASVTIHQREAIELALAHSVAGKTEAAYWRDDMLAKRTLLMADWARFCCAPSETAEEAYHGTSRAA